MIRANRFARIALRIARATKVIDMLSKCIPSMFDTTEHGLEIVHATIGAGQGVLSELVIPHLAGLLANEGTIGKFQFASVLECPIRPKSVALVRT